MLRCMFMKKILVFQAALLITLFISSLLASKAEDFNPKPASASVYNLGLKSYEQGDLNSATSFFTKAIELDPNFVDAYFNLGAIYKKQKNYALATNAFKKATEINSGDYEAVFELASCYLENKEYNNAKKYFSIIPSSFSKSNEVKQNLEKADRYLAIENSTNSQKNEIVKSPEVQGQLLVDKLEKQMEQTDIKPQVPSQNPSLNNNPQALVNTLTKPKPETINEPIRVVTNNFSGPTGIAKDSQNNIFVANFQKDNIEKIMPDGKKEVYIEKTGIKGPVGLAIDKNDNLYVANYNGNSIVKITPNKEISVLVNNIVRPYYLFYDQASNKLFSTVQGRDALVEIDTENVSGNPLTLR